MEGIDDCEVSFSFYDLLTTIGYSKLYTIFLYLYFTERFYYKY